MQGVCHLEKGQVGIPTKNKLVGIESMNTVKCVLALIAHASAISKLQCVSSMVFFTISPNSPLCRSFNPLLHGLSAGVVRTMIFKFCAMSRKDRLLNSLPLSVRIDPGAPKYVKQC